MENQHREIKGYRELSQEEIDFMNRVKEFGPQLETLINEVQTYLAAQLQNAEGDEVERLMKAEPQMWLWEGKFALQKGLMALTRSIAQPGFF